MQEASTWLVHVVHIPKDACFERTNMKVAQPQPRQWMWPGLVSALAKSHVRLARLLSLSPRRSKLRFTLRPSGPNPFRGLLILSNPPEIRSLTNKVNNGERTHTDSARQSPYAPFARHLAYVARSPAKFSQLNNQRAYTILPQQKCLSTAR